MNVQHNYDKKVIAHSKTWSKSQTNLYLHTSHICIPSDWLELEMLNNLITWESRKPLIPTATVTVTQLCGFKIKATTGTILTSSHIVIFKQRNNSRRLTVPRKPRRWMLIREIHFLWLYVNSKLDCQVFFKLHIKLVQADMFKLQIWKTRLHKVWHKVTQ